MITGEFGSDGERWKAVRARDGSAAGNFFYAVKTTGVVCSPGCASRTPRRANVEFFAALASALRAGYRPCKRCRPGETVAQTEVPAAVLAACRAIDAASSPPTLAELGAALGVGATHLGRQFKRALGVSPREYSEAIRARRFRQALEGDSSVTDAVYEAGYGSSSQAYANGAARLGMTPAQYKRQGEGLNVAWTFERCRLGIVAVAATERGICAVELGERRKELETGLRRRFAAARHVGEIAPLAGWVRAVVAAIDEAADPTGLPLDIRGTAFQLKVWRALRDVPEGETRSYADIAKAIGRPTAARAVAAACAANPAAVLVPCHRVLRSDGGLSGYRWGSHRKQALLEAETDKSKR